MYWVKLNGEMLEFYSVSRGLSYQRQLCGADCIFLLLQVEWMVNANNPPPDDTTEPDQV